MLENNDLNVKGIREALRRINEAPSYFSTDSSPYDHVTEVKLDGKGAITSNHTISSRNDVLKLQESIL